MDINQLLISLIVAACPMSLVIGVLATLLAMRAMGTRWPWEQKQLPAAQTQMPQLGERFMLYRVPGDKVARRTSQMMRLGWTFQHQWKVNSTNLFNLEFVWLGK